MQDRGIQGVMLSHTSVHHTDKVRCYHSCFLFLLTSSFLPSLRPSAEQSGVGQENLFKLVQEIYPAPAIVNYAKKSASTSRSSRLITKKQIQNTHTHIYIYISINDLLTFSIHVEHCHSFSLSIYLSHNPLNVSHAIGL